MILNLPKSCQGLRGYIDPTAPHAVNHIAVGDLGSEEIVVAVCDDGDVIAYTTRSICDAIEYDISHNTTSSMPANEPKTMLLQNVGMSAWGVAIHKSARLIAVSSNMHQISVFAFALDRKWSPDTFSDLEDEDAMSTDFLDLGDTLWERVDKGSCMRRKRFSRNLQIILEGHIANIPNIAFCNTKADLYGKYLVSTDILGYTYVWDIWERTIIADISSARQIDEICESS